MALDRTITWARNKGPAKEDVGKVVEDYACGLGEARWDGDRWYIDLPGHNSSALRRVAEKCLWSTGSRWIEVWIDQSADRDRECVDVMTRQHDEITNAIAEGLAKVIARFWGGEREP